MAHHKSALKRIRSSETKRLRNKYYLKTTRTFIKKLRNSKDKAEAQDLYKKVSSLLDKLAKRNIIHKNNAANKKAKLHKVMTAVQ
jgi:small subunit ribosomal protein S20